MSARSVSVTLTADVSGFTAAMGRAAASVDQVVAKTRESSQSIARSARDNSQEWDTVGTTLTRVGAMAAAGLGLSAKAAIDWESAWAGVRKTVDQTSPAFATLESDLRGMARTMATSHTEIAAVAESAGALGVATEDVAGFTRTMIMLGESTNLSAGEAADSLAQFMNVMGTAPDQVNNLGAALVALGNDGASTERQIVQMSQRIAGAGTQIGLSEAEVMGFASAMASVGIEVEAGGTAISSTMLKMEQAVRNGGAELDVLAQTAGMSSQQFKQAFQEDAAGAIQAFVEGLGRVGAAGGDVTGILTDLGITGIREADTLRRLASSGAMLADSLETARAAMADGGALLAEYGERANTTEFRVRVAWNNIKDAAISAGQAMLPAISAAAQAIAEFAQWVGGLDPAVQKFAAGSLAVVAAVGLIGGAAIKAVVGLVELGAALKTIGALSAVSGGLSAFGAGLAAVARRAAPLAIALAAVAVTARALNQALKESDSGYQMTRNLQNVEQAILGVTQASKGPFSLDEMFRFETGAVIKDRVEGIDAALQKIGETGAWAGFEQWSHDLGLATSAAGEARERFAELDTVMANMTANGQMQTAAAAFDEIAVAAREQKMPVETLIGLFPEYAAAVKNAGEALKGQNLTNEEMVELMSGRIPASLRAAAEGNKELANELAEVTGAFEQASMSVQDYANQLLALAGGEIGVEQAIANANEALAENGRTLDYATQKGRDNMSALLALGKQSKEYIQTLADQGKSHEEQAAAVARARGEFERLAKAMGMGDADIRMYSDALFGTVDANEQAAAAARNFARDAAAGSQSAQELARSLIGIPADTIVTVTAPGMEPITATAETLGEKIRGLPSDKEVTVTMPNGKVVTGTVAEIEAGLAAIPAQKEAVIKTVADLGGQQTVATAVEGTDGKIVTISTAADLGGQITAQVGIDSTTGKTVIVGTEADLSGKIIAQTAVDATTGKTVWVRTDSDLSGVSRVRSAVNALRDHTVYIRTVYTYDGAPGRDASGRGGALRLNRAEGGLIPAVTGLPASAAHVGAQQLAVGGMVHGRSPHPRADNVPIWATAGEVMMSNWAGDRYGRDRLLAINSGRIDPRAFDAFMSAQALANGGMVHPTKAFPGPSSSSGGVVNNNNTNTTITVMNPVTKSWAESVRQESALAAVGR